MFWLAKYSTLPRLRAEMNERFIEQAEALQLKVVEEAIRRAKQKRAPPPGFDGSCPECSELVPIKRIELGFYNCVDCQALKEQRDAIQK